MYISFRHIHNPIIWTHILEYPFNYFYLKSYEIHIIYICLEYIHYIYDVRWFLLGQRKAANIEIPKNFKMGGWSSSEPLYSMEGKRSHSSYNLRIFKSFIACSIFKKRQFLQTLMMKLPPGSMSPISNEWITAPVYLTETSCLLRSIFHKWRVIFL